MKIIIEELESAMTLEETRERPTFVCYKNDSVERLVSIILEQQDSLHKCALREVELRKQYRDLEEAIERRIQSAVSYANNSKNIEISKLESELQRLKLEKIR